MEERKFDALEQALSELQSGKDLEDVISTYSQVGPELKIAQLLKSQAPNTIPTGTMHRSRTRVLSRARQLHQESRLGWGWFRRVPRLAYALVLALILLLSWNRLLFASAQALPGDTLYPAKRSLEKLRLELARDPQTHREVEQEFQSRRVDEVLRLLTIGRAEFIQFLGVVEQQWDDYWIIEGIEVHPIPETIIIGEISAGMAVEVEGVTQPEGWVQASEIHLQNFSFAGTVDRISDTAWIISGQEVLISSTTQIDPDIQVGDAVVVEVSSDDFGVLTARSITRQDPGEHLLRTIETPDLSEDEPEKIEQTPEIEDVRDDDENRQEDESGKEIETPEPDEPEETDETEETDDPEETDELDETDDPEETDEPDETEESDETDEPDETDDPEETDKPNDDD